MPSLHLEEIQSDWHQQGRQRGYGHPAQDEFDKVKAELLKKYNVDTLIPLQGAAEKSPELAADLRRLSAANDAWMAEKHQGMPVPDAPFKKSWHELALKDALREAAEKGLDRISWTPGEAQAARYDLSKQIQSVKLHKAGGSGFSPPDEIEGQRGASVIARDHNGREVINKYMDDPEKELPDIIGKEAAQKLLEQKPKYEARAGLSSSTRELSGLDLKVGGEGMKGFYDKIIPDALNKIGKPHGVRVQEGKLKPSGAWEVYEREGGPFIGNARTYGEMRRAREAGKFIKDNPMAEGYPVHYMDIPQSLKDQALKKGFSLFEDSSIGAPLAAEEKRKRPKLTPVEHNPFDKRKLIPVEHDPFQ